MTDTLTDLEKRAIEYVRNTQGDSPLSYFIEDHEPIGPQLVSDLTRKNKIIVLDGIIYLVNEATK